MVMWGFLLWVWRLLRVIFFFVNNFLDFRSKDFEALWRKFIDFFEDKSIIIAVTGSVAIGIICILYMILGGDTIEARTNIIRNILLGLGALIGLPFLVWQNQTSHKALYETKKNNEKTQSNNDRTQEAKLFIDCITQLASDKETIRTAAVHGLHELIKNTKDASLQEKIFNILWSFMVEHSKECMRINDKMGAIKSETEEDKKILQDLKEQLDVKQNNIEDFYPQFKIILQILAEYKDKTDGEWWKDKSMGEIWLRKINLEHTVLKNANLRCANLQGAELWGADLQVADLRGANLQDTDLRLTKLKGASLQGAYLSGAYLNDTDLRGTNLRGSNLLYVHLHGADLQGVELQGAKLQGAYLWDADLQGAYLQGVNLQGVDLRYITYDEKTLFTNAHYNSKPWTHPKTKISYDPTKFPQNFDPKAYGMIDVSEERADGLYDGK